jgi:hypothetical protein
MGKATTSKKHIQEWVKFCTMWLSLFKSHLTYIKKHID